MTGWMMSHFFTEPELISFSACPYMLLGIPSLLSNHHNGFIPHRYSSKVVEMTSYIQPAQRLIMCGVIPPLPHTSLQQFMMFN
jgi:hypothetical protein